MYLSIQLLESMQAYGNLHFIVPEHVK